ncbi:MAG: hypothetical protein RL033_2636 [Pseudomonadota bacterium]
MREVATRFWLFTFAGLAVFGVVYYRHAQNELAEQRNQLAARQRAVVVATGQSGFALRDKLEGWVLELARADISRGELKSHVSAQASLDEISRGPGVYLRVRQQDAGEVEALRNAAARSLHDGFTSCLFVGRAPEPTVGVACKVKSQCGPGELCDDWGVCSAPGQPYNLRLLFDALKVQGPEWQKRLASASDDFQVRAMELELEGAAKHEVPAAAELVRRSRFFTAVLDEEAGDADSATPADAGVEETPEQRLQATDHFMRIGIWDIARNEALVHLRLNVAGRFVSLGRDLGGAAASRARQRQANNCAAAVEVREALLGQMGQAVAASDSPKPAVVPAAAPQP